LNKNLTIIYKDKMYDIEGDYVIFYEKPTKKELDNLPLTKVLYYCDEELDENFKNSNITYSEFGYDFNQPLDFLPHGLKELIIRNPNYSHDLLNLPNSLKKLVIRKDYKGNINLPPNCIIEDNSY